MKKVVGESLDSLDGYSLVEAPVPEPRPGQVRLRVTDCGLGYVDALVALGHYQVKPPLPHTPGQEIAGVVDALGDGVEGLAPGDRVMATVAGGFADMALAAAGACTRLPANMTSGQAAGFRINHLTALHGLEHRAALRPGATTTPCTWAAFPRGPTASPAMTASSPAPRPRWPRSCGRTATPPVASASGT